MPSIQDINAFKNAVNQLGNEPEIAQSREEPLENIEPGEEGAPLMPELSAAREAMAQETQKDDDALSELADLPPIMMDEDIGQEGEDDILGAAEDGDAEIVNVREVNSTYTPPQLDETAEPTPPEDAIPESVYQMLDTGFGELDNERFESPSAPLSDEGDSPNNSLADFFGTNDEIPADDSGEDDPAGEESEGQLWEESENEAENLGNSFPEDDLDGLDSLDGLDELDNWEDQEEADSPADTEEFQEQQAEEELPEDFDSQEFPADIEESFDGLQPITPIEPPREPTEKSNVLPDNSPAGASILSLEEALKEHRSSIDLLHLGEGETPTEENEFHELEFYISNDNARDFLIQIGSYPISLKIAIEEEISEKNLNDEAVETLIEMVSFGASPRSIANYLFHQTGKLIPLPKGQRYHGIQREEISFRFHRQFAQIGLPLLRKALIGVVFFALLGWLPFYYLYRPIQAYLYYKKGYDQIFSDNFNDAELNFSLATDGWPWLNDSVFVKGWPFKSWFLSYAEAYAARKDFTESTFKFRQTLHHYPNYREAWLQYIRLLSKEMGEYEQAEDVIQQYYDRFGRDYESLIIRGQNYLYWGEVDPAYYEDARLVFAANYSLEDQDDLPLLYLLGYYIRIAPYSGSADHAQLEKLTSLFLDANLADLEVPPKLFAQVMSQAANHYLDLGRVELAKRLLVNASQLSSDSMEVYRAFARYYKIVGDREKEMEALNMALFFLNYRDDRNTTPNLLEKFYLTKLRADFFARYSDQPFKASSVFNYLLVQLGEVKNRYLYLDQSEIANTYAMFGDFYYQNINRALSSIFYYQKAVGLGFQDPYTNYRYGYQLYQQKNFGHAVEQFLQSQLYLSENYKVKYALGNSLLQIGSYNSAQGIMEEIYSSIQEDLRTSYLLNPQHSKEARDRLFMLVRLANDLGVSYYREALQSPNIRNEQTAMAYLIQGMGYLDILSREDTMALKLPPNLLFRPLLLTQKTIDTLEDTISAQGLVPGSLPDRNLKQILESRIATPAPNRQIQPYLIDILDPTALQETMEY